MAELSSNTYGSNNITIQVLGGHNAVTLSGPRLGLRAWQDLVDPEIEKAIDILGARAEAVPVVGRQNDLDFLCAWLNGGGIRITAIIGQGGSGKTRLALEFLKAHLPSDWQGGFMDSLDARWFEDAGCRFRWEKHTLVVVDYAAIQAEMLKKWFERLGRHQKTADPPLRILLLERHGEENSGWYKDLTDDLSDGRRARKLFQPSTPRPITPLSGLADRRLVLAAGLTRLSQLETAEGNGAARVLLQMPQIGEEHWFDERLRREEWADPLLLLMAALVASEDGVHSALSMTRPEVALWVAGRERSRLQRGLASNAAKRLLVHLYACVILCRSLSHEEACAVAASEFAQLGTEYPNGGAGEAVEELKQRVGLSSISPPEGGQPAKVLARLQPDLLAGAFLLQADLRAETAMRMAHRPGKARDVAQMLIFTTRDFGADDDRPVEWLQKIIEKGEAEIDVLIEIEAALPVQTLAMRRLALAVGRMLVAWARKKLDADGTIGSASRLAFYLNNCSLCESAVGDRNGALQSIREAVEIRRNLHDAYPDASALASSLSNLSIFEGDVGDRNSALESSREAVALYRKLHGANPDAFAPDLAKSLNNLSNRQSAVGDRNAALESIREAVAIRRKLHTANPDAFAPDLASSLNNLSVFQSGVGDREGALESSRQSVALYRKLHGANRDAFAPYLAGSLNNLSIRQSAVGDRKGALASSREAVALYRKLHGANPDAFAPDLASSLNNLSIQQSEVGDREGALESSRQSVALYRKLHGANRDAFAPYLASSLNNLSTRQSTVGDREGALVSIRQSVDLYRKLHGANTDAFASNLAHSLSFLGDRLHETGMKADARDAAEESLRVLRPDFEKLPKGFRGFEKATVMDYVRRSEELGLEVDWELLGVYAALFEEAS